MSNQLLILAASASMLLPGSIVMAADSAKVNTMPTAKVAAPVTIAANTPHPMPVAVSKVLENLAAKGYMGARELELDDGVYKINVVTSEGEVMDVKANLMTGELMNSKGEPKHLSIVDIAKKVEEAGYRIIKIKADDAHYKVKALDKEGKKSALKVNAMNGEISKKWFD